MRFVTLQFNDTTSVAIPYGNGARVPVQRTRDLLKEWSDPQLLAAKSDSSAIYVLLGLENATKVHYAQPVKNMLYDALSYASQVDEAAKSYRRNDGIVTGTDGEVKLKLTSAEFLSGFRKEDRLIPVVTLTVYLGSDKWDGPRSLHEMLSFTDKRILAFVPDYKINLIVPCELSEEDFSKFQTGLGFALSVLKHQNEPLENLLHRRTSIDRDSVEFLNRFAGLSLEAESMEGEVNMIKAVEDYNRKMQVKGAVKALKLAGISMDQIIKLITDNYGVTREYVEEILAAEPVSA